MTNSNTTTEPNAAESAYIAAMSRKKVVDAYAHWTALSEAEEACLAIGLKPGSQVLDLGCGAGRYALRVRGEASSYLGIDASEEMIAAARVNCPELHFRTADIVNLDMVNDAWDLVVLAGNVLDYLQPEGRRASVFDSCARWLRDGGMLIGSSHLTKAQQSAGYYPEDYHGALVENYRASFAEIADEVESHGLEIVLAQRDYRDGPADWCYWVATRAR